MYVATASQPADLVFPAMNTGQSAALPVRGLQPEQHLFREGDRVDRIYRVLTGAVRLTRLMEDGRRQIIAFGLPGDVIGFPRDAWYQTDCEALTNTELQPFRLSALENGAGDPDLHLALLRAALREIAAMQDHFMMLGRKSAVEKVASFLIALSDRIGTQLGQYTQVSLSMNRADIADFLGLTTETVSRTFSQFRKSRMIALDGVHTVIILCPEKLQDIAAGNRD